MKKIDMIQNSDDWYKMRNNYLGASESNIIMGHEKFMTVLELWKLKTGEPKKENKDPNFIQAKGHRIEAKMRPTMEMLYDTDMEPIVVVSEEYPFLMASLDGYSESVGFNWECKYVGQEDYEKVSNQEMLMHYYPQVQHQLMLTGAPFCVFTVAADVPKDSADYNPDWPFKYAYMEVQPDHDYMKNKLLPKLVEFWNMVENKISPEIGDKDVVDLSANSNLTDLLGEYQSVKEAVDREKELKKEIFKCLGKAKKAVCNGVKITISKSADKKDQPDLDAYLKEKGITNEILVKEGFTKTVKGRSSKRITFPKPKSA
jgi:putative phage-type endonuclease